MKILNTIGKEFAEEAKTILQSVGDVDYKIPTQADLANIIGEYEVVFIGLGLNFHKDILEKAGKLKVIATATTGLDHIDVAFAEKKGITVLSLRGENEFLNTITGTAELALGLMIDLARRTPFAFDAVKKYKWKREDFKGISLFGKTLGVLGLGRLGSMTARFGKALGMKVIFTDPFKESVEYEKVSFEELLKQSDVISIHVHLLPETQNMFAAEAFKKMKKNAVLINTSRGKIVEEGDLLEALQVRTIAGYAADVLADELEFEAKGFKKHPLVEYAKKNQNLILVPHIGGMTVDSRIATDVFMAEKVQKYLKSL